MLGFGEKPRIPCSMWYLTMTRSEAQAHSFPCEREIAQPGLWCFSGSSYLQAPQSLVHTVPPPITCIFISLVLPLLLTKQANRNPITLRRQMQWTLEVLWWACGWGHSHGWLGTVDSSWESSGPECRGSNHPPWRPCFSSPGLFRFRKLHSNSVHKWFKSFVIFFNSLGKWKQTENRHFHYF